MGSPVIIHRWFEQGAGWAYGPALEEAKRELMTLLDGELKTGVGGTAHQPRIFRRTAPDGRVILGCVVDDERSLDVKAQGRRPTILRATILPPITLTDAEEKTIIGQLTEKWPVRSGQDRTLTVDFQPPTTVMRKLSPQRQLPSKQRPITTPISWSKFGLSPMKLFIVVLAILAALWWEVASWRRDSSEVSLQPVVKEMQNRLDQWGEKGQAQDGDAIIDHFFLFLSRQPAWGELPKSKHPYNAFVKRLPSPPAKAEGPHWTTREVEHALNDLIGQISGSRQEADSHDFHALFQEVDQQMGYENWRNSSHNSFAPEQFADDPGPEVTKYVEKFRRVPKDFVEASNAMKDAFRQWNIKVIDPNHPFAVMQQFFRELRPPDVNISARDSSTDYAQFTARFKYEGGSLGWTCDDLNGLDYALKKLSGQRDVPQFENSEPPAGLIESVERQTKFTPSSDKNDEKSVPSKLREFAQKFNPSLP